MAEVRIKDMDEHEIDTILAEDIDFEGHLTFKKPLMIKGKFKGEIKSTSSLYIGEKAYVEATTEAAVVSSKGMHKGDIVGHSRVELFATSQVEGDITTPDFVMESGCRFNGYCAMGGGTSAEAAPRAENAAGAAHPAPAQPGPAQPPTAGGNPTAAAAAQPPVPGAAAGGQQAPHAGSGGAGPSGSPPNPQGGPRPGQPTGGPGGQQR
ncbi:MAG TPA: polymer-forming cytoskeletal protein [Spirochaetia bacterium]|nr:polymer-forming cytoskeletal protein [Spirochaetia bacterium]